MQRQTLPTPESVLTLLDRLDREDVRFHMEWREGRCRLRYRDAGGEGRPRKRRSVALPEDVELLAEARRRVEAARWREGRGSRTKRNREARKALRGLKRKVLAASGRGRDVRRRIGWMFDRAAAMGMDMLEDFINRGPWLARGRPAGRPRKAPRA